MDQLIKLLPIKFIRYHYYRIQKFVEHVSKSYNYKNKKILDIGAGDLPFKKYFSENSYFSQDIIQNKTNSINFIGDMNKGIPAIKKESFDYILCTQVLEHLYDPKESFKEFSRILKPKGYLFLTTHMVFDEHMEPNDYFRFTKYGLKTLGDMSGFNLSHISPHGGIFTVLAYLISFLPIKLFMKRNSVIYYVYLVLFFLPIVTINVLCYFLDFLDRKKTLTINYECIFKKK